MFTKARLDKDFKFWESVLWFDGTKMKLLTISVWFSSGKKNSRHSIQRILSQKSSIVVGESWDRVVSLPMEQVRL